VPGTVTPFSSMQQVTVAPIGAGTASPVVVTDRLLLTFVHPRGAGSDCLGEVVGTDVALAKAGLIPRCG
jgi:hypothetical protein